jgi:uncharacterized membrane protein
MHTIAHTTETNYSFGPVRQQLERWGALALAAGLVGYGVRRRSALGWCVAASAAPLVWRGIAGRWPGEVDGFLRPDGDTRAALGDRRTGAADRRSHPRTGAADRRSRGVSVRESIRLETPVDEVYRFWARLENLPRFMSHLVTVTDLGGGRSHWAARGPAGVAVEWDAEIINQIPNRVLAWRSLPGGDLTSAGSATFEPDRADRGTWLTVTLQYASPVGPPSRAVAPLFGGDPSQAIREDLRTFKQLVEAGEIARASAPARSVPR